MFDGRNTGFDFPLLTHLSHESIVAYDFLVQAIHNLNLEVNSISTHNSVCMNCPGFEPP